MNIIGTHTTRVAAAKARNQDIVSELREALARAEQGELTDMLLVAFDEDGHNLQLTITNSQGVAKLAGLVSVVHLRLISHIAREIDSDNEIPHQEDNA